MRGFQLIKPVAAANLSLYDERISFEERVRELFAVLGIDRRAAVVGYTDW